MKEIVEKELKRYEESYELWCLENPGKVMHNDGIRIVALQQILNKCNTKEDIIALKQKYLQKQQDCQYPMNGFGISAQTCQRIIELL